MNRIRVGRMLVAGMVTLLVFVAIEFFWEGLLRVAFLSQASATRFETFTELHWSVANHLFNIVIALMNTIMMMWLYVSLRPMFGVGTQTALIASAFVFVFVLASTLNNVNLRFLPPGIAASDLLGLVVELPIALVAGARFYEAGDWVPQPV